MANLKASKKDIRKSRKRQTQNAQQRSRLRTFDKKIRSLVEEGKLEEAGTAFKEYSVYLDRAGKRSLIHQSQSSRRKSRMAIFINKSASAISSNAS